MPVPTVVLQLRIPPELHERLKALADQREKSMNQLALEILTKHVKPAE